MAKETLAFGMHEQLLVQTMKSQAGSLEKAILEGVMNGVDAGATEIRITTTESSVTILDDGQGFTSKEQLIRCFGVFGQPHEAIESKMYGTFRIGRGQMFCFGVNRWRSGTFEMNVDVENKGITYDLEDSLPKVKGCAITITLYEPLLPSDAVRMEREIKKFVAWVSIPVFWNDVRISKDPAKEKWDFETDEAYFKIKQTSNLSVYNLGVFVRDFGTYTVGVGGIVVAKRHLTLNQARNDILGHCKAWKSIRAKLHEVAGHEVQKKSNTRLTDDERQYIAEQIKSGEADWKTARNTKVITTVAGHHLSISQMSNYCYTNRIKFLTVAPQFDRIGDKVHEQKRAFVLSEATLDRFGVNSARELVTAVLAKHHGLGKLKIVPLKELAADMNPDYVMVSDDKLSKNETLMLNVIRGAYSFHNLGESRRIVVGESDVADGWTDGSSMIAVHRKFVKLPPAFRSFHKIGALLLHEYCHDDNSANTHTHSSEFLSAFEDNVDCIAAFVEHCMAQYPTLARYANRSLSRQTLKFADQAALIEKEVKELAAVAAKHAAASTSLETAKQKKTEVVAAKAKPATKPRKSRPAARETREGAAPVKLAARPKKRKAATAKERLQVAARAVRPAPAQTTLF